MAERKSLQKLQQPIRPAHALAVTLIVISLLITGNTVLLGFQNWQTQRVATQQSQTLLLHPHILSPTPSLTPTPTPTGDMGLYILNHYTVDTSNWKTYRDWKYSYSLKLPSEFASYIPTKGYTGNTIDPEGNGFVEFEDTTLSGGYPYRTFLYGFSFRLEPGNPWGEKCTTVQGCNDVLTKRWGQTRHYPLRSRILNRVVNGIAIVGGMANEDNIRTGQDVTVSYYYLFPVNGQVFTVEIDFDYPDSFQETQRQQPTINAILSSIFFIR